MTNAETKRFPGQSVSRILSSVGLRFTLLLASSLKIPRLGGHLSGVPISRQLVQPTRDSSAASRCSSLLGLAPGGGYPSTGIAARAGGLLHHHFTLTYACIVCSKLQPIAALGGMFLWPDPAGFPAPGVSPAPCSVECGLSSATKPSGHSPVRFSFSDRPTDLGGNDIPKSGGGRQWVYGQRTGD